MSDKVLLTNRTGDSITVVGKILEHMGQIEVERTVAQEIERVFGWVTIQEIKSKSEEAKK